MALFKDINEVKEYLAVNLSFQFPDILPYIKRAEEKFIIPVISQAEYDALHQAYTDDTMTDIQEKLLERVRTPLINFAYFLYIPIGNIQIDSSGYHISTNENTKQAFQWQVDAVAKSFMDTGYEGIEKLYDFLENYADPTEYIQNGSFDEVPFPIHWNYSGPGVPYLDTGGDGQRWAVGYGASPGPPAPSYLWQTLNVPLVKGFCYELAIYADASVNQYLDVIVNTGSETTVATLTTTGTHSVQIDLTAATADATEIKFKLYVPGTQAIIDFRIDLISVKHTQTCSLWAQSSSYTVFKECFIHTAKEFSRYFNINESRRTFLALKAAMRNVEHFYIRTTICTEFFDELKAEVLAGSISAENQKVLDKIKPAVANLSMAKALNELSFEISELGITLSAISDREDRNAKHPAPDSRLSLLSRELQQYGNAYLGELIQFLADNIDDYPTYENSDCYTPTEEEEPDGTGSINQEDSGLFIP